MAFPIQIQDNDVDCTRVPITDHTGNIRFGNLMAARVRENEISDKVIRYAVAEGLLNAIHSTGGRFLKQARGDGSWVRLADAVVIRWISLQLSRLHLMSLERIIPGVANEEKDQDVLDLDCMFPDNEDDEVIVTLILGVEAANQNEGEDDLSLDSVL